METIDKEDYQQTLLQERLTELERRVNAIQKAIYWSLPFAVVTVGWVWGAGFFATFGWRFWWFWALVTGGAIVAETVRGHIKAR